MRPDNRFAISQVSFQSRVLVYRFLTGSLTSCRGIKGSGRVVQPFGFTLTDPSERLPALGSSRGLPSQQAITGGIAPSTISLG
jgi:hypothetical protein